MRAIATPHISLLWLCNHAVKACAGHLPTIGVAWSCEHALFRLSCIGMPCAPRARKETLPAGSEPEQLFDPNSFHIMQVRADLAASFQVTAIRHLEERTARAVAWAQDSCPGIRCKITAGLSRFSMTHQCRHGASLAERRLTTCAAMLHNAYPHGCPCCFMRDGT